MLNAEKFGIEPLVDHEIDQVQGGLAFIPIAIAFGKGFAAGAATGGGIILVADALDLGWFKE